VSIVEPPEPIDGRSLLLAPEVVGRLIQSTESERAFMQPRSHEFPERERVDALNGLNEGSDRFQSVPHLLERHAIVRIGRGFPVPSMRAVGQFHDESGLDAGRFA
jgi:hypothetical protein